MAKVAKEFAWVFSLLRICDKLKNSNFVCIHLTWPKYSCILASRASNFPFTWSTTSVESENIFTVFPPIFWTIAIAINKISYSASLFVVENPNRNDFSMVIFLGDTRIRPTWSPLVCHSIHIYSPRWGVLCGDQANRFFIHAMPLYLYFFRKFNKLGYRVDKDLAFYRGSRHVFDIKSR